LAVEGRNLFQEAAMQFQQTLAKQWLKRWSQANSNEEGVTLLEALVAVLIVSVVAVSITPPIFLSVATRVQNRRAEQAIQLAQGEIDKVRVLLDEGGNYADALPPKGEDSVSKTDAPTSVENPSQDENFPDSATTAFYRDVDGDEKNDFFIQVFRGKQATINRNGETIPVVFQLGVRVYSIVAEENVGNLKTTRASLQMTTGQGDMREYPLAVLYTELGRSDSSLSRDKYSCFADRTTDSEDCADQEEEGEEP
jgi:type II secretory pathway pseudopilin PulG